MYRRILLPLDGSEISERAVAHAARMAEHCQADLILVMVIEPLPAVHHLGISAAQRATVEARKLAREYLERVAAGLQEGGLSVNVHTPSGQVHTTLLSFAEAQGVDLIVLSSRGRSGPSRWLMGSVADRVVRGAQVPVLLVPWSEPAA